ncbi:CMP-N-acetylneuraminic acid synthetase [Desulfosporosinus orientis DSM 765]|uniref:CMP-N-acetylneuraminic acid synthetase n=1 Tax=Desulfosporosinus orientis (strain ATCC 19365 / DSM 765 / NCIMB 8382 / VKM B-1628 / Singapore I) TaxID=768706 RepID=G7W540_DESOD|nr:acylneuraminate cytidylyltransferase family protein [Desulfosporosinus orientis]AET66056.1 CMP-N-acetylneuraminic acid synthetase [Desulfosporosinus orientis DSM 765]
MLNDRRIIAIIPARSGSKGLPDKNIRLLNGKPLIAYSILQAQEAGLFDEIFLSTDSQEYANIAIQYGANVPFLRSEELASDSASTWDCVREALEQYSRIGQEFDIFVVLQPTSPSRTPNDITNAINEMILTNADSVVSVCEADHYPMCYNILPKNKSLKGFIRPEFLVKTRQELPTYYRINGAIFAVSTSFFSKTQNIYAGNSFAFIMPIERSIDIDTLFDFSLAEYLLTTDSALKMSH